MTTRRIVASLLAFLLGAHPLSAVLPPYAVRAMSCACPTSAATLEAAYAYDDAGNLTGIAYSNGIEAGYTYDAAYRLDVVTWTDTATQQLVAQFDCDVNALGLRTAITEAVQQPGGGVDTDLVEYEYDKLGRLTRETRTRGQDVLVDKSYQYDLFGNRTKVINHIGPSEQEATFNELHQLETDGNLSFFYDDSGNLYEKKQGDTVLTRYEYDFLNRLSKVTHNPGEGNEEWQTYEYDAEGGLIRIERDTGAVKRFVNDHHSVTGYHQALVELDGQSSVLARMVYGLDLVKMSRSGEYYYIYDPLGSTRALTDDQAAVTDTYAYDAYGNTIEQDPQPPNGTENAYLFTGERLDAFTGFYYLRARFYDPSSGRFTQLDTFLGSPQDPLSLHRYLYCRADPVNLVDPGGHQTALQLSVTQAVALTIGVTMAAVVLQAAQPAIEDLSRAIAEWAGKTLAAYWAVDQFSLPIRKWWDHTKWHGWKFGIDPGWDPNDRRQGYGAVCNAIYTGVTARGIQAIGRAGDYVYYRLPLDQAGRFLQRYLSSDWLNRGVRVIQEHPQVTYVELRVAQNGQEIVSLMQGPPK